MTDLILKEISATEAGAAETERLAAHEAREMVHQARMEAARLLETGEAEDAKCVMTALSEHESVVQANTERRLAEAAGRVDEMRVNAASQMSMAVSLIAEEVVQAYGHR